MVFLGLRKYEYIVKVDDYMAIIDKFPENLIHETLECRR